MTAASSALPYGPATVVIRKFLVQLAALDHAPHDEIISSYQALCTTLPFDSADQQLSEAIARSGRTDARDALFGPFLQLMRERDVEAKFAVDDATAIAVTVADPDAPVERADTTLSPDDEIALDPIAESALAALMSLLVYDLLPRDVLATLYSPYEPYIPIDSIIG